MSHHSYDQQPRSLHTMIVCSDSYPAPSTLSPEYRRISTSQPPYMRPSRLPVGSHCLPASSDSLVSSKSIIQRRQQRQTGLPADELQQSRVIWGFEFLSKTRSSYGTQRGSHQWTQLAIAGVGLPTYPREGGRDDVRGFCSKVKSPRALGGSVFPLGGVGEVLSIQQVGHCSGMY